MDQNNTVGTGNKTQLKKLIINVSLRRRHLKLCEIFRKSTLGIGKNETKEPNVVTRIGFLRGIKKAGRLVYIRGAR